MTDASIELTQTRAASWIENFVGMLLSPFKTLHELAILNEEHLSGFGGAAMAVIVPCALDGLRMSPPSNLAMSILAVPASITMGLTMWLALAGLLSLLGWVFGASPAKCRRAFVLTGWSFVPWIFMGPLYCYQEAMGDWFPLVGMIPFIWMFVLQMAAAREAFELRSTQMLMLFFGVPFLYFMLQTLQVVQTFYVSIASVLQ